MWRNKQVLRNVSRRLRCVRAARRHVQMHQWGEDIELRRAARLWLVSVIVAGLCVVIIILLLQMVAQCT